MKKDALTYTLAGIGAAVAIYGIYDDSQKPPRINEKEKGILYGFALGFLVSAVAVGVLMKRHLPT